jgi:hypothetical protein
MTLSSTTLFLQLVDMIYVHSVQQDPGLRVSSRNLKGKVREIFLTYAARRGLGCYNFFHPQKSDFISWVCHKSTIPRKWPP